MANNMQLQNKYEPKERNNNKDISETFLLNYILDYKDKNIRCLTKEKLQLENEISTAKDLRDRAENELSHILQKYSKEWLNIEIKCEENEEELFHELWMARECAMREESDKLKECRFLKSSLPEMSKSLENNVTVLDNYRKIVNYDKAVRERKHLPKAANYEDEKAFIESFKQYGAKTIGRAVSKNLHSIREKALDEGLEIIAPKQKKAFTEKERILTEIQMHEKMSHRVLQGKEKIEHECKLLHKKVQSLKDSFFGLLPVPKWPTRLSTKPKDQMIQFGYKKADIKLQDGFNVPYTLQTALHNYKHPHKMEKAAAFSGKKTSTSAISVIVEKGSIKKEENAWPVTLQALHTLLNSSIIEKCPYCGKV